MAFTLSDEQEVPYWRHKVDRAMPLVIGGALILAMMALLYFASMASRYQNDALHQQQRSYEVAAVANRLDSLLAKAESSLARYVISMDKNIGRQYQDQWAKAGKELATLVRETRNDPVQRPQMEQLLQAYKQRGLTLSDIALRTTYDQKNASLSKFYQASSDKTLSNINNLLRQIIDTENNRLRQYNRNVALAGNSVQQMDNTYRMVGIILLMMILLLIWFARAIIHERRQEQRLSDDEYIRSVKLEAAVADRTAELQLAYAKLQRETEERARAEQSLRQAQKMEAVGQLTGGIAHDFNNMLAIVVGGLELAKLRAKGQDAVIRHLDNAMEGANRATALTRRLLAFARAEPNLPDKLEPDAVIIGVKELLDRSIGDQIKVKLDLSAGDWAIHADQHQLENALLNLAVNARDAMEGKGLLTLRTRQSRLRAGEIQDCMAGEYVCLSVADTGCGMTPDVLERAFDPFFTTKAVGKGTGLGLSQIFGFVGQAGGYIHIITQPGEGTEVLLYLPRHHVGTATAETGNGDDMPLSAHEPDVPNDISATDARHYCILLVEDDPRVLAQTRSALIELGHQVISCDHPAKAADLLHDNSAIELILSDVLMPDMTGPEMIAALPDQYRAIPVLFITGYAGDVNDNRMFEGHGILRKPYTLAALEQKIAEAMAPATPVS